MQASKLTNPNLLWAFNRLLDRFGHQNWWPGDTPFEVMAGAILTQNTAWTNVEKALAGMVEHGLDTAQAVTAAAPAELAAAIRPAGYFNVKAKRLQSFCQAYLEAGGLEPLEAMDTQALRSWLLAIHGIGRETADDILLYVFRRPVFVIDAYTRRILSRLGWVHGNEPYDALREGMEAALGPDVELYNEYHALIVQLGKDICRPKPRCGECPLSVRCPVGQDAANNA